MEQQPSGNNTLKGFSAAIVAAVCYGTNPLGTLKLYEDDSTRVRYSAIGMVWQF